MNINRACHRFHTGDRLFYFITQVATNRFSAFTIIKQAPESCKSVNPVNPDSDNEYLHSPIKFLILMRGDMSIERADKIFGIDNNIQLWNNKQEVSSSHRDSRSLTRQ